MGVYRPLPWWLRKALHRRGILRSPSADLFYEMGSVLRPGRSRWEGFEEALAQARGELLLSLGWEKCAYLKAWDSSYASVPEPDRWAEFWCPDHDSHKVLSKGRPERLYIGKSLAPQYR